MRRIVNKRCACCREVKTVIIPSPEYEEIVTSWVCQSLICQLVLSRYKAHQPNMSLHLFYQQQIKEAS